MKQPHGHVLPSGRAAVFVQRSVDVARKDLGGLSVRWDTEGRVATAEEVLWLTRAVGAAWTVASQKALAIGTSGIAAVVSKLEFSARGFQTLGTLALSVAAG
jgi:hypothetical protein